MLNHVSAGTLPEGNSGRDHRWRPWRESRSCDHWPRGQWDGDYSLEPDAGHSEEACVHVAPPAQDLVFKFPSRVNETLCSSRSFHLWPWGAAASLKDKKFWLTPYLHLRGRNLKSQCQRGAAGDWFAPQLHSCACYRLQIVNVDFTLATNQNRWNHHSIIIIVQLSVVASLNCCLLPNCDVLCFLQPVDFF